jgi:NAD(P)-dependent dehydrogenase (short-subunit alcohol dehydrogenase family)
LRTPPNAIREARFWFDDYGIEWGLSTATDAPDPTSDQPDAPPLEIDGAVAVVTGGAGGIGGGIVGALLRRGATVVVADVEPRAIDAAIADLSPLGAVTGHRTDISDERSVAELADHVYATHGRCNVLYNNAGVTSGGGGKQWQQEPNDWQWCFGVNVFGTAFHRRSCPA